MLVKGTLLIVKFDTHYQARITCIINKHTFTFSAYAMSASKAQNKVLKKFSNWSKEKYLLQLEKKNSLCSFTYHKEFKLMARKENIHHWQRHCKQIWNSRTKVIHTNGKTYERNELMTRQQEKQPHEVQVCGMLYKNTGIKKPLWKDNGISKWNNYIDAKEWSAKKVQ